MESSRCTALSFVRTFTASCCMPSSLEVLLHDLHVLPDMMVLTPKKRHWWHAPGEALEEPPPAAGAEKGAKSRRCCLQGVG